MQEQFILSEISDLQQRKLEEIESKTVCMPYELISHKYKKNELKFLLHVYIYMKRGYDNTLNLHYVDFFKWTKTSKAKITRAKKEKQINDILKEMEDNSLIKILETDSMYVNLETCIPFVRYTKDSFYSKGFTSVYLDEVQKIMDYDTSKIKGVTNGLLLYTYVWLVRKIKYVAYIRDGLHPCYYVKEFYCNLCNEIYDNSEVMKDTIKCLQDLGLVYATTPKRYIRDDGNIAYSATVFVLSYLRDCKQGIEYYGENYIKSVLEYEEKKSDEE